MSIKQAEKSLRGMAFFSLLSKRMVGLQIEPQYLGASGFQECRRKCRIFWQDSISILTLPLVSTTSKHQTPQELGSGHPCPSASMCVCSGCLHCTNEEKRAFFLRTTLLDTHRFFMGSCGWGWACSEEGLKRHQAESHYLLCFSLCHCSRRLSRKFWCNLKLTITQYNPKFI